jgi:hypothetical protein
VTEPAMIISMPTIARSQQRYDHRLRNLVQPTGDVTVATDLGVPRSTARGWLGETPTVVVCLDVTELTEPELRQEVVKLRRRVRKLMALLRLVRALRQTSGFRLSVARLPDGRDKLRILRAVDRAPRTRPVASAPAVPACLAESVSCLGPEAARVCARRSVFLSAHIPVSTDAPRGRGDQGPGHLARISSRPDRHRAAARQGPGLAPTWYRLVRQNGWRRPRLRVHPAKPQVGLRTTRADEMWHIDTTVIHRVLPHSAFHGQTPDEMYLGTGDAVPADLQSRATTARRTRAEANRSALCKICPSAVPGRVTMEC